MSSPKQYRIAHLGGNRELYNEYVSDFKGAYEAHGKPEGMAMFSHSNTEDGTLMTVSITPQSVPYCPFSVTWEEKPEPRPLGNVRWVAGDIRLKPEVSEFPTPTH